MVKYLIFLMFFMSCGGHTSRQATRGPDMPVAQVHLATAPHAIVAKLETDLDGKEVNARQELRALTDMQLRKWQMQNTAVYAGAQVLELQSWRARQDRHCLHAQCFGLYIDDHKSTKPMPATEARYFYLYSGGCSVYTHRAARQGYGYKYFLYVRTGNGKDCPKS